jgi:DNA-3-methyladenine glycosylase I
MAKKVINTDSVVRCEWSLGTADYVEYHDSEWGRPTMQDGQPLDSVLFEKLCLEGFQSGLSWLTILRKRPAFREVFAEFDAELVASYGESEIADLLADARIIRHRGKITATINNAQALLRLYEKGQTLAEVMWSHQPEKHEPRASMAQVPATTPESTALAKQLKSLGFRFVGPTTAYAAMQAMGVVNDHMTTCFCYEPCQIAQQQATKAVEGLKS